MNQEKFQKLILQRFLFPDGRVRPEWLSEAAPSQKYYKEFYGGNPPKSNNWKGMKAVQRKDKDQAGPRKYIKEINTLYIITNNNGLRAKVIYSTPTKTYIIHIPQNPQDYREEWNLQKFIPTSGSFEGSDGNSYQVRNHPISFQFWNEGRGWSLANGEVAFIRQDYLRPPMLNWLGKNPWGVVK